MPGWGGGWGWKIHCLACLCLSAVTQGSSLLTSKAATPGTWQCPSAVLGCRQHPIIPWALHRAGRKIPEVAAQGPAGSGSSGCLCSQVDGPGVWSAGVGGAPREGGRERSAAPTLQNVSASHCWDEANGESRRY